MKKIMTGAILGLSVALLAGCSATQTPYTDDSGHDNGPDVSVHLVYLNDDSSVDCVIANRSGDITCDWEHRG